MRAPILYLSTLSVVLLAGCGPQDHPVEFYTKAENAAEFAKALEICSKSGLSQKDKCATVWQAKIVMDRAEDRELFERAVMERAGITVVPQAPKPAPVTENTPARKASNTETVTANSEIPPTRN